MSDEGPSEQEPQEEARQQAEMWGSDERSATTRLREWLRDRLEVEERASVPVIAEEAIAWLQGDGALLDKFVYEQVYNTAAQIIRSLFLQTRHTRRLKEMLERTPEEQDRLLRQWLDRKEHVSPSAGYVRLGAMTKVELLLAAEERAARGAREFTHARWYRMLASGLGDAQTVEQRYTAMQVAEAYGASQEEVTDSLDAILSGVEDTLRSIMGEDEPPKDNGGAAGAPVPRRPKPAPRQPGQTADSEAKTA